MTNRRIGRLSLIRLLGNWRSAGTHEPGYRQLAGALRLLIIDGRLGPDVRLPSERELASELGVSRGTVSSALAELRADGYLSSRHGAGTLVALPEGRAGREPTSVLDLSIAASAAGPEISEAYAQALGGLPTYLRSSGYAPQGIFELREVIAARYTARGLPTKPDEIMIVNGALAGLALLLRLLTSPGDKVLIDHTSYALASSAIRSSGCRPIPVSLPDEGWDLDGLKAAITQIGPHLAYLLPDHHNPTGRCMDAATRTTVGALAGQTRTMIVADETMADLWYDQAPPPPLAAYDPTGHVVTLGSTNKSFWGGLRIGWIRASSPIIVALGGVQQGMDLGAPILEQLAVAHLLAAPERHLSARRLDLCGKRDALVASAAALLPDWYVTHPIGGLACWVQLPAPMATRLAAQAEAVGVRIAAGPAFGLDGAFERNIRIPFTAAADDTHRALERLVPVWRRLYGQHTSRIYSTVV